MDTLDGRYSRMSGKGTQFGAFLDSSLDRIEEAIVLTAVAAYFASRRMEAATAATAVAIGASLLVRRRWARIAWRTYPLLVTFVVVATANHFFIDVFLGALTAGAAVLIAKRLLARARPEVWAFSQAPA